jgi:hypothetical protein
MADAILSAERLREVLDYDQETGIFTWKLPTSDRLKAGKVAGVLRGGHKYPRITVDYQTHGAHRLAWLHVHGVWPSGEIDHVNGDRSDNRIANLRDVPSFVNMQNQRRAHSRSASGLLGAWFDKRTGRWAASISVRGKRRFLGRFSTAEDAHAAYVEAKRRMHEGCTL